MTFHGRCHCGNLEVFYETAAEARDAPVRACQCTFCRKHGVRATSDANGALRFVVHDEGLLSRYRFGLGLADFLLCGRCGVYVGAVMQDGARLLGTLNVSCLDDEALFSQPARPMNFDAEDTSQRNARRRANWTPATLSLGGA